MDDATKESQGGEARSSSGASLGTDVHRTKIAPDDSRLQIDRPRSRTLRRGPVVVAIVLVAAVVALALVVAVAGPSSEAVPVKKDDPGVVVTPESVPLPDVIKEGPRPESPKAATASGGASTAGTTGDLVADRGRASEEEELARARTASVFSGVDDVPAANPPSSDAVRRSSPPDGTSTTEMGTEPTRSADRNFQERKNDFLERAGVSDAMYLEKPVDAPRSPFEVKAGTVIPTVLITGINSDLPGQVVAQVRENVYDTVTGNHLLIPQGSRLLAAYDSMVAWGQERVLVCWNRLVRPDGSSISLACMPGTDLAGYSGFADEVDNHWRRIIVGVLLSSVLAATAQRSQGDVAGYQPTVSQAWVSNAAGQINQAGQQLTQRNLQIQPTITVRPGFSVNVLVTKDIVIEPYHQGGSQP
jgi:type IV secretion system protein VirB10